MARLCGGGRLGSPAKCVRERICVDGVRFSDGDVRMVCTKSRFLSESFVLVRTSTI